MAERKIDTTVMLEERIEHDPESRDVLSRCRLFNELITSAAEDSDSYEKCGSQTPPAERVA